jgi:FtsP/CotA-like multicopper oxidase with cupredoxin domain
MNGRPVIEKSMIRFTRKNIFFLTVLVLSVFPSFAQHRHSVGNNRGEPGGEEQPAGSSLGFGGPHSVIYQLNVRDTLVNYTGKKRHALAINGSIPAPTLYFTEGDTAEVYVHNFTKEETVIHWHGVIVPNQADGVPYLTTAPISPGQTHLFRFPVVQSGTYWYHSHQGWQQQVGMYGAIVIHKRREVAVTEASPKEFTMLLSDWTDENPYQVDRSLHDATDWYAIKKGSTQNYGEALQKGYFKTKLANEWKRMMAMDVSDVAYDRLLVDGKPEEEAPVYKAGDRVRLHIVNGSASTYCWLQFAGGKMTVIANDGSEVVPVNVDRVVIAVAETYDVLVTIPDDSSYEFRSTSEDRTKSASLWLGAGIKKKAPVLPALRYFNGMKMMNEMMDSRGNMKNDGMSMSYQAMDMNAVMYGELNSPIVTLSYSMLRSPVKTTLPDARVTVYTFNLTGNMNRYVWTINNKTVSETDKILIRKGENVRMILYNNTMMRHPMHLHGHFFRILNGQGDFAPLKTTLDIMPMERDTIEFAATASGDWYFHCHILYHMMSGMGRIFSYENSPPNPEVPDPKMALKMVYMDDRMIHPAAQVALESNGSEGEVQLSNTRFGFQTEWKIGLNERGGYESESHFGRYLGRMQWWFPYVGWDFRYRKSLQAEKTLFGQDNTMDDRKVFCAGLEYVLPMLVVADARVDTHGKFRFQLSREGIPITSRLRFRFTANSDKEYTAGLSYIVTKYFAFSTHYDSDLKFGAGITLRY